MAVTVIWLAATPALFVALHGDRAAIALLLSLLATYGMEASGIYFHALAWAALDVLVCVAVTGTFNTDCLASGIMA